MASEIPAFIVLYSTYNYRACVRTNEAQNGGPPGWLEESDTAGVILYVMDGPHRLPLPNRTGCPDRSCPAES